jgi:hypothetical protein
MRYMALTDFGMHLQRVKPGRTWAGTAPRRQRCVEFTNRASGTCRELSPKWTPCWFTTTHPSEQLCVYF